MARTRVPSLFVACSYTDSNWRDKLTAYDGQTITYDAIGNPLNDGTWTYTWEKGRQLKQMSKSGMTVEFKYDHNGLRTQKKVTSGETVQTTEYTLHGKLITHLTRGSDTMYFFYDAQSRPAMVEFNGTLYGYVHNLQGDIVGIIDNAGNLVVEYVYDAWGKPVVVRTLTTAYEALAELNPFRYRGYVYDGETGLYYLTWRYYSLKIMRFLSIDSIFESVTQTPTPHNIYVYTRNNAVSTVDIAGNRTYAITFTVTGGLFVGYSASYTIAWDDAGNITHSVSHGPVVGLVIGGSFGVSFQMTEADTVYGITDSSATIGGLLPIKPYWKGDVDIMGKGVTPAFDLVFLDDEDAWPDGFQGSLGIGIGVDLFHIGTQESKIILNQSSKSHWEPFTVTIPPASSKKPWLNTMYDPNSGLYYEVAYGI